MTVPCMVRRVCNSTLYGEGVCVIVPCMVRVCVTVPCMVRRVCNSTLYGEEGV